MPWLKKRRTYRITRISDRSVNKRFALRLLFFVVFLVVLIVNAVPPPMEFEEEEEPYGKERQTEARPWPVKKLQLPEFSKKADEGRPVPIPQGTLVQETGRRDEPVQEIQIEYDDVPRRESEDEPYELEPLPEDARRVAAVQVIKKRRAAVEEKNRERTTTPTTQAVPEPGAGCLLVAGVFLVIARRRREG